MLTIRSFVSIFLVAMLVLGASVVSGQNYPNRTIRIVTAEPGGFIDFASRLIAPVLTRSLGQPVIVENRSTIIATETVAKASPDGYTLLVAGSTTWILPYMRDHVPWDPVRDFSPITLLGGSPIVLAVHPSVPVKSVTELIALARSRPGELNYVVGSNGTPAHLAAELFKTMAGINMVLIPYKGLGAAITALLSNEVQLGFASAGAVASHFKSGRLRVLAVTSAQPSELLPGLPTVAASGLLGYEAGTLFAMFAPAKTPAAIINRLNQETVRFLKTPEAKERFLNSGVEVVGSTPGQLAVAFKSDMAKMGKVIKDAGIRAE